MSITTFAAIDVGSNEISMKIFEFSKKYGVKEIDYLKHSIELGVQTYKYGKIKHALINELCDVLLDFTKKMAEYQVVEYTAYATSAIREANNKTLILDRIKLSTGLKVKIISNSEQRFLYYKAIALKENAFNKIIQKGTAIVDVGAGSIQISLFNKDTLIATQNIKLGSLRINELLSDIKKQSSNFNNLISEYIDNELYTFNELYMKKHKIKNIIAIGDYLSGITKYSSNEDNLTSISRDKVHKLYNDICTQSPEAISLKLSIPIEHAELTIPTAMIYDKIFNITNADLMWLPGITLCDGIIADYAEKKEKILPKHNFANDIVACARNIAARYHCNIQHSNNIEYIALTIFDNMKKLHGMGRRERLILQIAIILHNCGEYINMSIGNQMSYNIIMSTEIIGLSHIEREVVANLALYNSSSSGFPEHELLSSLDKDIYIKIAKLSAILKIADAMDRSHKQKFSNIKVNIKNNNLVIATDTLHDITLERRLFEKKAEFFEEVYGIKPILKQKRSI